MSRIAKLPIPIAQGVELKLINQEITAKGPKGQLNLKLLPGMNLNIEDNQASILVETASDEIKFKKILGTYCRLLNNIIIGVQKGFEKKLKLEGVGFRAKVQANVLNLSLGFSHPVNFPIPDGVQIEALTNAEIIIKGTDKQLVNQIAANIRSLRPPESYKGKGVRYIDEKIILKVTKKSRT